MQNVTNEYIQEIDAPVRKISAKVELYNDSTLDATYTENDRIKSIDIERVGEDSKFFGFGVSHKYNIKLIDTERALNISTANSFKIYLKAGKDKNLLNVPSVYKLNQYEFNVPLTLKTGTYILSAESIVTSGADKFLINFKHTDETTTNVYLSSTALSTTITFKKDVVSYSIYSQNNYSNSTGVITTFTNLMLCSEPEYIKFPTAHVTEVHRDENTNELSITAYDILDKTKSLTFAEIELAAPYTIKDVAEAIGAKIGVTDTITGLNVFDIEYTEGANFEGTETLEEALRAIAEATQTIYFINSADALVFKRLDKEGAAVKTIDKEKYITLDSKTNRRLAKICHCTELGDNVSASITENGTTQYIRDNPFLALREDIAVLLENAIAEVGGLTINQFSCEWRGDFATEPADKIELVTKDNEKVASYILNDTISYNGSLAQTTEWQYTESEETESNPTTLGDTLKQTYARVDKANKKINMVVNEVNINSSLLSSLQIETNGINATVQEIEKNTNESLEGINNDFSTLAKAVETKVSAEDVTLEIKKELENGVTKVETATGFKFDESGLTISKTGSEMATTIDDDGMTIKRDDEERLVADNEGVKAYNLYSKTYLIVGESSRFEDYEKSGEPRTGCFWIGETGV